MSNFDFLRCAYPKLADLGCGAERNYGIDNEICMIKLGQLAEGVAWQLSDKHGLEPLDGNAARINALRDRKILPEHIFRMLDALRSKRNYYIHEVVKPSAANRLIQITDTECLGRLKMAYELAVWFVTADGVIAPHNQPFVVPTKEFTAEKYQQLNQELTNRIASLKRELDALKHQQAIQQNKDTQAIISNLQDSIRQAEVQVQQYRQQKEELEKALSLQQEKIAATQQELKQESNRADRAALAAQAAQQEADAAARSLQRESQIKEQLQAKHTKELQSAQEALDAANKIIQRMEKDVSLHSQRISHTSKQYCPHCFAEIDENTHTCSQCGRLISEQKSSQALCTGTLLADQFIVGGMITQSDSVISYNGYDQTLRRKVTILEYFPVVLVSRNGKYNDAASVIDSGLETYFWSGLRRFVSSAQEISEAGSSKGILTVYEILEINDTAYIILEDTDGVSFKEYVNQNNHGLPMTTALRVIQPIFYAADYLQQNQIFHYGIAPDLIFMRDGQFCLAGVFSNYGNDNDGRNLQADIQSLASLFYWILSGHKPETENIPQCEQLSAEQARILSVAIAPENASQPFNTLEQFYQALYSAKSKQFEESVSTASNTKPLDNLTAAQRRAVTTSSKRMVVVAGPGSGKTLVLTERVCYLLEELQIPDSQILALTFTSKAANEMQRRILKRLPSQGKYNLNVRTFHSLGLRILRTYGDLAGYRLDFHVIDTNEKNKILRELLRQHRLPGNSLSSYAQSISKYKNQIPEQFPPHKFQEIFNDYQAKLLEQNAIDFDDMLYQPLQIVQANETVRQQIGNSYTHILIDEFQDVNKAQIKMIKILLHENAAFFIVGDDDQCIYEWRGSKPTYLQQYVRSDKNDVIKLEDNFRSGNPIVQASNLFIAHNQNRIPKSMRSCVRESELRTASQNTRFIRLSSEKKQAAYCAQAIQRSVIDGQRNYGDFAILVRLTRQMEAIKEALSSNHIPYTNSFEEDNRYDRFLTVLQTVDEFYQSGNLTKSINYPSRILDSILWKDLIQSLDLDGWTVPKSMEYLYYNNITFRDSDLFHARYQLLYSLYRRKHELTVAEIVRELVEYYVTEADNSDLLASPQYSPSFAKQVLDIAEEYTNADLGLHLHGVLHPFLEFLQTALRDESNLGERSDAVKLMTCHKSKGLEFPVVFIPGVQVGEFPDDKLTTTTVKLEEERRLFYVTMTRAKEELYILCYKDPLTSPSNKGVLKRGFLAELPNLAIESR